MTLSGQDSHADARRAQSTDSVNNPRRRRREAADLAAARLSVASVDRARPQHPNKLIAVLSAELCGDGEPTHTR